MIPPSGRLREVLIALRDRWRRLPLRLPLLVLGLALVVLDLLRSGAGPLPDRLTWCPAVAVAAAQWLLGLATLAVAGVALHRSGVARARTIATLALGTLLLGTYVDHLQDVRSDGVLYYSYVHSVLFDFDLALGNDFVAIDPRLSPDSVNASPVGTPILWAPFVAPLHAGWQAARILGAPTPNGTEPAYQAMVCLATFVYATIALFLLLDTLGRWSAPAIAFWATLIVWLGSPLRFYVGTLPSLAHGCEFFAAVLVLRAWLALRARLDVRRAVWVGLACGLLFLVRSQDGLLLGLPLFEIGVALVRGPERRATLRCLAALLLAFVLAALPQMAVWQVMFGRPLLVPYAALHGASFMHLTQPRLVDTLCSAQGGLFASYPMTLLALLGLIAAAFKKRTAETRGTALDARYLLAVLPVMLAAWYLNATIFDWYHVRRFTGVIPLLAPGLVVALAAVSRSGWLVPAVLALFFWRYDREVDALRQKPGDPAPVRTVLTGIGDGLVAQGLRLLEPVAPRTTAALFSAYSGEAPLAERVTRLYMGEDLFGLRAPWPARNLSQTEVEDGRICRWVCDTSATVYLMIRSPRPLVVSVDARPLETPLPQTIEARWNGCGLGSQTMDPSWRIYRFHVPGECVRPGVNEVLFAFERTPVYHRVRGHGPRQVRPAAFAEITLHHDAP